MIYVLVLLHVPFLAWLRKVHWDENTRYFYTCLSRARLHHEIKDFTTRGAARAQSKAKFGEQMNWDIYS